MTIMDEGGCWLREEVGAVKGDVGCGRRRRGK